MIPASRPLIIRLREPAGKPSGVLPLDERSPQTVRRDDDGDFLLCANCRNLITTRQAAISAGGGHQHTFANPHGLVYTIGCFGQAPGCGVAGAASTEFTWFPGFNWRVAVCAACLTHLGWRFSSSGASFYGLILDRLAAGASGRTG